MSLLLLLFITTFSFSHQFDENSFDSSRILGGSSAFLSNYPPCFTTIFVTFEDTSRRCGGCVISGGDRILTSASCISTPLFDTLSSNLNFAFGLTSIVIPTYWMTNFTRAPDFDVSKRNSSSDIAVIKLNRNAVKLIGVRTADVSNSTESLIGKNLFVCGFGYRNLGGLYPATLMCTALTVVESEMCFRNQTCPSSDLVTVPDGIICTQNKDGKGICHGDEGSPVFLSENDSSTVVGVISYVADRQRNLCGSTVVITQVGSFKDFVDGAK